MTSPRELDRIMAVIADHGWGHAMPMDHADWRDGESAYDHIRRHIDALTVEPGSARRLAGRDRAGRRHRGLAEPDA